MGPYAAKMGMSCPDETQLDVHDIPMWSPSATRVGRPLEPHVGPSLGGWLGSDWAENFFKIPDRVFFNLTIPMENALTFWRLVA